MKNLLFVICLLAVMLVIFSSMTYANDVKLIKLDNIPDNAIAACKVKSNNFVFTCILNTKNYYNCKFVIGSKFTLPVCKPCDCESVKEPVKKPASNSFLDAIRNY